MSDPERIWLQNANDARATGDRLWCQDKVWPECAEQQEPTEYIRADLYASRISQQDAELERLRREVEEAKEGHEILRAKALEWLNAYKAECVETSEARKAAFIEAAEIAEKLFTAEFTPQEPGFMRGIGYAAQTIFDDLRAKAEGQP